MHVSCLESHAIGILGDLAVESSGTNRTAVNQLLALYCHKNLKSSEQGS